MKITIEGTPKEIASLVLELQERRAGDGYSIKVAKGNANDLIHKDNDIAEIGLATSVENPSIR